MLLLEKPFAVCAANDHCLKHRLRDKPLERVLLCCMQTFLLDFCTFSLGYVLFIDALKCDNCLWCLLNSNWLHYPNYRCLLNSTSGAIGNYKTKEN